ncbi:MAG: hypothetical protein EAZ24_01695 [Burkholderiales bacterium]|nr:MAG: hypothetical protein EAZ21_11560 [Betaproteobacteria bacterium]TAG84240.1 MAG: hypothetical protein EAZ24_01695 [Burkholderiales bacterium]
MSRHEHLFSPNAAPKRASALAALVARSGQALAAITAVLSISVAAPATAQISSAERAVLVSLYNGTNGASWTNTTAPNAVWTVAASPGGECAWFGVVCAPSGSSNSVVEINLPSNNLAGALPASLNTLSNLRFLRLQSNSISGALPSFTGLNNLSYVDVRSNQLTGSLPSLAGLTSLEAFSFSGNQIAGQIPSLTGLTALKVFQGSNNLLSGNIPSLTGLSALEWFHVDSNQLSGALPSLSGLSSLQSFYASNNALTGALPSLSGLTALRFFRADANQITGTLPSLAGLNALEVFFVRNNQIAGAVTPVPAPTNALAAGLSALCPNQLTVSAVAAWDAATGSTPWSTGCVAPRTAQTLAFGAAPLLLVSGTATVAATASPAPGSSASVSYTSLTPSICSVNASSGLVTALAGGVAGSVCTIAADKAGDASFNSAPQVTQSMTLVVPINGVCGSANGVASFVAPSANLCASGTASAVTSTVSQFSWSCAGLNTGTTSSCTAPRQYNVTASAGANGTLICATPIIGSNTSTCTATPSAGYRTLSISGCGGTTTAAGVNTYTTAAITADCTVAASFEQVVVGACGSANGVATVLAPSANLCAAGTASAVTSGASSFTWTCAGAGGGSPASCAAPRNYTVTASFAGLIGNGSITPTGPQSVTAGSTISFTIAVGPGQILRSVGGTCGGTLTGTTYVTSAITGDCTVLVAFDAAPIPTMSPALLALLGLMLASAVGMFGRRRLNWK